MAVTLEEIAGWLDTMGIEYLQGEDKILFGANNEDETNQRGYFIRAKEDGDIFEAQMQLMDEKLNNITIKDHEHLSKVLEYILYLNYNTKFGTWEFDPSDGDIRLAVEIPLEDAKMTEKQFARVMSLLMRDGGEAAAEVREILKTGEIPKKDDAAAEMLAKLEALLAAMKEDSSSSDEEGI
jgi:hypothetical protein